MASSQFEKRQFLIRVWLLLPSLVLVKEIVAKRTAMNVRCSTVRAVNPLLLALAVFVFFAIVPSSQVRRVAEVDSRQTAGLHGAGRGDRGSDGKRCRLSAG